MRIMLKKPQKLTYNPQLGFTLLLASLVASLLLGISAGIFSIVFKEITLSSSARESQFAFYAADTGIECALFWDLQGGGFATSTGHPGIPGSARCAGQDLKSSTLWSEVKNSSSAVTSFSFEPSGTHCTVVEVRKNSDDTTRIESRGYNTCDTGSRRRVERGIRVSY
jgi:hypothetical protein